MASQSILHSRARHRSYPINFIGPNHGRGPDVHRRWPRWHPRRVGRGPRRLEFDDPQPRCRTGHVDGRHP